jgi:hypothetical protein
MEGDAARAYLSIRNCNSYSLWGTSNLGIKHLESLENVNKVVVSGDQTQVVNFHKVDYAKGKGKQIKHVALVNEWAL